MQNGGVIIIYGMFAKIHKKMAKFQFSRSYFSDNGEMAMSVEQRIKDALNLLHEPEDYIELEDGVKCYNRQQLTDALTKE